MFAIAICDDDLKYLNQIKEDTIKYFDEIGDQVDVETFSNPDDLLLSIEKLVEYDVLLLDICMPGMFGTELLKEIRNNGYVTEVIFFTNSKEYAIDAFALKASNYILKPYAYMDFSRALGDVIDKIKKSKEKYITLKTLDGIRRLSTSNIIYTESQKNYLLLHLTKNESETIRDTNKNFIKVLNEKTSSFVSCGASYIVNLEHINKLNPKELILSNKAVLPIPKGAYVEIKDRYFEYYFD